MLKTAIASIAAASALFLGCGVAHADPVDDAIAAWSEGEPTTVQYLNAAKAAGQTPNPDAVGVVSLAGYYYCTTPSKDRQFVATYVLPGFGVNVAALKPSMVQYCTSPIFG